ncbi:sensor histidine kinase N-terminal domain-containing protein [Roseomonas sp. 18066]|uniref:sensor histidine kinase N-terminal domain-containing protein n=1 Tax=Roseomonas sp. 18066 TaxID=2681412 RepID=UPI001359968F|nr:sensor histidine kinase N-terminal domain-containing protein [Roseomonas sp. 18066]
MKSIQGKLFAILLAGTGLLWLCAAAWIYAGATHRLQQVLDSRLQASAHMVASLLTDGNLVAASPGAARIPSLEGAGRPLSCQVWSLDGRLVARSEGAPLAKLSDQPPGFADHDVGGEPWRVYVVEDAGKGLRILVGDRLVERQALLAELIKSLLVPGLLILPLLGLLIWACLARGFRPLRALTSELNRRSEEDMRPIEAAPDAPTEIRPVVQALNDLFAKVEAARRQERAVTAFAAHELRTPLAGLKAQAQIAIAARGDAAVREGALRQILVAVDRTTRLVKQLLSMAKLDSGSEAERLEAIDLESLLAEVTEPQRGAAGRVEIAPELRGLVLRGNRALLALALRNLHENAVQHMPPGGLVRWGLEDGERLYVEDEGPGIPPEELPLVTQRFFRGRHKSPTGSGLGLAITELALRQGGWALALRNRASAPGLRAEILLRGV